jgi:tetratricopeptide (TPR) repeat protein
LSPELAEAHVALGRIRYTYDRDWPGAEASFRRALEIDPNNLDAHYFYAMLLMGLGRFAESIEHIERAAQLDPLSSMIQSGFGRVLYRARRYDEAIEHLHRAIALEPRNYSAYSRLGDVYDSAGRYAEALASYEQARGAGFGENWHVVRRARVYARMGRTDQARRMLQDLESGTGVPLVEGAKAYAALGDRDRAFELLFQAVDEPSLVIFIKEEPTFDRLHPDARWKALLAR